MTATWDLVGNQTVLDRLQKAAGSGRPNHAYLLAGPPHLGKSTAAQWFARALLCSEAKPPCGTCVNCRLVEAGNHPDFQEVSDEGSIGIGEVRDLKSHLGLKPHSARHRVTIIPNAERLSLPAQNALLKLLEEPPATAVLILTAASPAALLPTTVSRTQQIRFTVPSAKEVSEGLARLGQSGAEAVDAAALADRRPGLALELAREPERLAERRQWVDQFEQALGASTVQRLQLAKELAGADDLAPILDSWISIVRQALNPATDGEAALVERLRQGWRADQLAGFLKRLFEARRRLRYNPNVQLLAEQLLLRLGT